MTPARDYSLTGPENRRAVAAGLSAATWYQSPVPRKRMKELMQRSDGPAVRDTLIWLLLIVASGTLAAVLWPSPWAILALLVYGVLYGSASDSRWHECGHGTAFKTRWMNTAVYHLACFMIMRNPTAWRWSHARHHTDTLIVGRDPEIVATRPPALLSIALNFFGVLDVPRSFATMARHAAGRISPAEADYIPATEHSKVSRVARIWLVIYLLTIVLCFVAGSVLPVLLIGLPRTYGAWHHLMTGLTQHGGLAEDVTDHRLNSRSVTMNPISRFIYWNMNYHVEHHMFPMVPYHRLPELSREIGSDLPVPAASILAAYREFMPVLLRQRTDPSFHIRRVLPATQAS